MVASRDRTKRSSTVRMRALRAGARRTNGSRLACVESVMSSGRRRARRPAHGESIAETSANGRLNASRGHDHTSKLSFRKAAQDRNSAVVARNWMESQHERRDRKAECSEPTPPEIADDHSMTGHAVDL